MSELAHQLIAKAKRENLDHLDLGRCGLKAWPEELFELHWLKSLKMSNRVWNMQAEIWEGSENDGEDNQLNEIPIRIAQLNQLECLYIGGSEGLNKQEDDLLNEKFILGDRWQIYDLSPIASLSNLTTLDASYNSPINQLSPIAGLSALKNLNLKQTTVSDLVPLRNLKQMEILNLGFTSVREISPLQSLTNLHSLSLTGTPIDGFGAITFLKQLENLNLANTEISSLEPLAELNKLLTLNIAYTGIRDIGPMENISNLIRLNLNGLTIDDISVFDKLTNLQELEIAYTVIKDLSPISKLVELKHLLLSGPNIQGLNLLENLKKLETLDLSSTIVEDLGPISRLKKLKSINLSGSSVKEIDALVDLSELEDINLASTHIEQLDALSGLSKLKVLNLFGVQVKDLNPLAQHINLVHLDLQETWIENLDSVAQNTQLQYLNLNDTAVSDVGPLSSCIHLKHLGLANTRVEDIISIQELDKLVSLDLHDTAITSLEPIKNFGNLTKLDLQNINIQDLTPLEGLTSLQFLDLTQVPVDDISPLHRLGLLRQLNLSRTKIRNLAPLANLKNLNHLNLNKVNNVSDLSPLKTLSNLRFLDIQETEVNSIFPIAGLRNLEHLNLRETAIRDFSPLANFVQLKHLDLQGRIIKNFEFLEKLPNLSYLNLERTDITDLSPLSHLFRLDYLCLAETQVKDLSLLGKLLELKSLNLHKTRIENLDPLSGLKQLEYLNISNTTVSDLSTLNTLENLQDLNIKSTRVRSLAPVRRLIELKMPIILDDVDFGGILVFKSPIESPPISIIRKGNASILRYFAQLSPEDSRLYEAKLIIVGDPGAGKTSLARRLINPDAQMPNEDESTRGIEIKALEYEMENGETFIINLWDFGGHAIYHSIHQFFLTERSLYILVNDTRMDYQSADDASFDYWLKTVKLFGGNSPLLIVQNEKEDRSKQLDLDSLRSLYGFIKDCVPVNIATNRDLDKLIGSIKLFVERLPQIGAQMPANWTRIRNELERLALEKPYLNEEEYFELCSDYGYEEREQMYDLSRYLHDLGVCLHFQHNDILSQCLIIQKEWATSAIYKILDDETIKRKFGRFDRNDIYRLWDSDIYRSMYDKLIELMEISELCFSIDRNQYLIPKLFAKAVPVEQQFGGEYDILFKFSFNYLPRGLFSRYIVRVHEMIGDVEKSWNRGVVLNYEATEAELIEVWGQKEIWAKIRGTQLKGMLAIIRKEFKKLFATYERIEFKEMVACNCSVCRPSQAPHFYDFEGLILRLKRNRRTVECNIDPFEEVSISSLLEFIWDIELNRDLADVELQEEIRDFIAAGEFSRALNLVRNRFPDNNQILKIMGPYEQARMDKLTFNISIDDFQNTESNSIAALLLLLDKLF